jgi:hypothetical protein
MIDTDRLNASQLARFGESCIITLQDAEHPLTGVFRAPRPGQSMGGVPMPAAEPVLQVRSVDLAALGELSGARVRVRDRLFTVGRSIQGDDGLTDLELREQYDG